MKNRVITLTGAAVLALCAAAHALPPCNPHTDPNCDPPPSPPPGGSACTSVTATPPSGPGALYSCAFTITDAYGRPVAGVPGSIESRWCNRGGSTLRQSATSTSDASGRLSVSVFSLPSNVIACQLDPSGSEPLFSGRTDSTKKQATAFPTRTVVTVPALQVQPAPTMTRSLAGLDAGSGRMDLYQSGTYDKVLLVAEQFDQLEHGQGSRDRRLFWRQLAPLLTVLFGQGWDIWLVQPHDTGESLHEQAAEFAQAIAAAQAMVAPAHQPPFTPCQSPTVSVLGFNTGGLVARIATARWEADPAWRALLALPDVLPVKALATFDAPHYGMHLNLDMQESAWHNQTANEISTRTNLDSCAASQVLRGRYDLATDTRSNTDFLNFFVNGTPTHFFSKADGTEHACAAGPAVATLNAGHGVPGWPSGVVRIGFTQSHPADATKCFTDPARNRNGDGQDLCTFLGEVGSTDFAFVPTPGQTWLRLFADDPGLPDVCPDEFWDVEDRVEWSDITPGSRSPLFLDGFITTVATGGIFCEVFAHQRFPSTLVPFVSAAGTQGPAFGSPYEAIPSPFTELHASAASRVADVVDLNDGALLMARLNAFAPGCTPPANAPN